MPEIECSSAKQVQVKTAAFLLPSLQKIIKRSEKPGKGPRVLVLTPTRELAAQVEKNAQIYANNMKWVRTLHWWVVHLWSTNQNVESSN